MIVSKFVDFINKKYDLHISPSYYTEIDGWKEWYQDFVPDFHTYSEMSLDGAKHTRKMYRLSMAKTVCEDWASMLLNDRTTVTPEDPAAKAWILGSDDGTAGLLQNLDFWNQSNRLIERMMRSGTAAWVVSVDGMAVDDTGGVLQDDSARIAIDYLPAECILPITCTHGKITECAFASEVYYKGRACIYLQIHTKEKTGYKIENRYYQGDSETAEDGGYKEIPLPPGIAPVVHTGCPRPWFAVIAPNAENNKRNAPKNGMGVAIYANAEDALKMVDIAYNNYVRDLRLGGKKLFYNKKLVRQYVDSSGVQHTIAPDDVQQQLFWIDGTSDPDQHAEVYDYNPSLRTGENRQAVQDALNYLSMKCGMGGHYYVFDHDAIGTATQYIGDKKTLTNSINRHHITIEAGLIQLTKALLWIGKNLMGLDLDDNTPISVAWDESYISDPAAERDQMRADVAMHLIPAYMYVAKYYNVPEDQARQITEEAEDVPALELANGNAGRS